MKHNSCHWLISVLMEICRLSDLCAHCPSSMTISSKCTMNSRDATNSCVGPSAFHHFKAQIIIIMLEVCPNTPTNAKAVYLDLFNHLIIANHI